MSRAELGACSSQFLYVVILGYSLQNVNIVRIDVGDEDWGDEVNYGSKLKLMSKLKEVNEAVSDGVQVHSAGANGGPQEGEQRWVRLESDATDAIDHLVFRVVARQKSMEEGALFEGKYHVALERASFFVHFRHEL